MLDEIESKDRLIHQLEARVSAQVREKVRMRKGRKSESVEGGRILDKEQRKGKESE